MRVNQCFCTYDKSEILKAIEPLYEHAKVNRRLFEKKIKVRDCEFNGDGYVRWDLSLITSNRKNLNAKELKRLEDMDLVKKCKKFLDSFQEPDKKFCLKITAYTDGFQLDIEVKTCKTNVENKEVKIDSLCYFIERAF
ncbi:hypothetical protein CFOLD11_11280 [Clostridium folliculivorans]|uniref:Uncharacterized protein n=1 Tax=Clostridium folliculivorans TaxID=2886038 RepID=A0A9W6D9Z8_9CLOT|nr:hypothetical protein [Clostridium folliculivorans]GKU24302.1 hypothetical protein CFOLD11_11280 [Clostridium folliculivorans]